MERLAAPDIARAEAALADVAEWLGYAGMREYLYDLDSGEAKRRAMEKAKEEGLIA